ncbi:MAG: helix-turn-helix domain-containing protein [Spirochaetaceae bacterium]|nr:helix-turn-helix domain-containing protein [Spirochaetaceae bacterium]
MDKNDFSKLIMGVEQLIDHKNGKRQLRTTTRRRYQFMPLREYDSVKIRSIRTMNHLSQNDLADLLGVKKKTVQAWEASRNVPSGVASRLLSVIEDNPEIIGCFVVSR